MANSRSLRATRSGASSSTASLKNGNPRRGDDKRRDKAVNAADERRGPPHVTTRKRTSPQFSTQTSSSSASTDGVDEDDAAEGDDEDDDDMTDVHAPPSDHIETKDSMHHSAPVSRNSSSKKLPSKPNKSWAGLRNSTSNHDSPIDDAKDDTSNDLTDPTKDENSFVLDSPKLDGDEDISDVESANFDLSDNDDDYAGVDNVSTTSEDSREFEADVEREIQAAGEDGIDWDDENTYLYDTTLSYDLYGFSYESGMVHSLLDLDLFSPDHHNDMRLTQSAPAFDQQEDHAPAVDSSTRENMLALDRSLPSDSEDTSPVTDGYPRGAAESKEPSKSSRRADVEDGDTTDEDISWTTVSSPGVTLSREHGSISRKVAKNAKQRGKGRKRPVMRRILPNPDKAIAYSVPAPFGSTVRFCTPRTKTYRWMDLRGSPNSSRASSPTMINLEDAYLQGNTRTGAHITDVINGTLFSALHCRNFSVSDGTESTPAVSNFYRPLLGDGDAASHQTRAAEKPVDDSALALIDFSGGVGISSSDDEPNEQLELGVSNGEERPENHLIPPSIKTPLMDEDVRMMDPMEPIVQRESSSINMQIPMTPPSDVDVDFVVDTSLSPKKRRLSNRSNDRRKVNPAIKKQRFSASSEVLV